MAGVRQNYFISGQNSSSAFCILSDVLCGRMNLPDKCNAKAWLRAITEACLEFQEIDYFRSFHLQK